MSRNNLFSFPKIPVYKNAAMPADRRVRDLLVRMTVAEKAAQMMCGWQEKAQKLVDIRTAAGDCTAAARATLCRII